MRYACTICAKIITGTAAVTYQGDIYCANCVKRIADAAMKGGIDE